MENDCRDRRKQAVVVRILVAIAVLAGVGLPGGAPGLSAEVRAALGIAGYVAVIALIRSAMLAWRNDWDELLPLRGPKYDLRATGCAVSSGSIRDTSLPVLGIRGHRDRRGLRIAGLIAIGACAAAAGRAQQTIFNVPSADVLAQGKTYLEGDALWRPSDPSFGVFTGRGVYGLGENVEAGVNFGGFLTPGRSVPIATPNVKWEPFHSDNWSVTTGAFGLFFLRGATDGKPAALGYAHVAGKLSTGTRLTAGGYWGSSGYAAGDVQKGILAAVEQPIGSGFTVAADWFSGRNGLGYFTPGLVWGSGPWTLYGAWTIKNGSSHGNAALVEVGITF